MRCCHHGVVVPKNFWFDMSRNIKIHKVVFLFFPRASTVKHGTSHDPQLHSTPNMLAKDPYVTTAGGPVVVQGTAIGAPTATAGGAAAAAAPHPMAANPTNYYVQENYDANADFVKGEKQPKRCNDMAFAILFYAHLAVMAWVAATYVPIMSSNMAEEYGGYVGGDRRMMESSPGGTAFRSLAALFHRTVSKAGERHLQDNNGGEEVDYGDVAFIMVVTGMVGLVISAATLTIMMMFAQMLIKMALIFNIVVSLAMGIAGILSGVIPMAVMGFLSFAWSACYARAVWPRIPFAVSTYMYSYGFETTLTSCRILSRIMVLLSLFSTIALLMQIYLHVFRQISLSLYRLKTS